MKKSRNKRSFRKAFILPHTQTVSKTSSSERKKKKPSDCKPDVIDVIWYPVKSTNVLKPAVRLFSANLEVGFIFQTAQRQQTQHEVKKPRRPAALDWLAHWAEAFTLSVSTNIYHRRARMRSCKQWGRKTWWKPKIKHTRTLCTSSSVRRREVTDGAVAKLPSPQQGERVWTTSHEVKGQGLLLPGLILPNHDLQSTLRWCEATASLIPAKAETRVSFTLN